MPANASIAILDGAATPASHTYYPTRIDSNNVATFQDRISDVPVGFPTLTWSLRAPTPQSPTYKLIGQMTKPKVILTTDTTGKTISSVDYVNFGKIELVFSSRSSKAERTDVRVMLSNLLKATAIVSAVDDLESFW